MPRRNHARDCLVTRSESRSQVSSYRCEGELAAPTGEEALAEDAVGGIAELGIDGDQRAGFASRFLEQGRVAKQIGDPELGQSRLACAEELARTAQLEINLGDAE